MVCRSEERGQAAQKEIITATNNNVRYSNFIKLVYK